ERLEPVLQNAAVYATLGLCGPGKGHWAGLLVMSISMVPMIGSHRVSRRGLWAAGVSGGVLSQILSLCADISALSKVIDDPPAKVIDDPPVRSAGVLSTGSGVLLVVGSAGGICWAAGGL